MLRKLRARPPFRTDSQQNPPITPLAHPCSGRSTMSACRERRRETQSVKLTYDDFLLFPDDGQRHELIDGEHYVTPSPNIRHQDISGRLHLLIDNWLNDTPARRGLLRAARRALLHVRRRRAGPAIRFERASGRAPRGPARHGRAGPRRGDCALQARDNATRRSSAACSRTRLSLEYWVVDPDIDVIRVYRRDGDRFARPVELSREAGDVLTSPLFPGLDIPLSHVFGD